MSLSFRRIFFLLGALTAAQAAAQTPEKSAPNVVLITIDTLRADHLGCYGYKQIKTTKYRRRGRPIASLSFP
jgi:hypothetical protein